MTKRNQRDYTSFTYETEIVKVDKDIAIQLVDELKLVFTGSARYHVDGNFYNLPNAYPITLFDLWGYVTIASEHEFKCKLDVKKKVHLPDGIRTLKNYIEYKSVPKCLKKQHELERIRKEKLDKSYQPFRDIMGLAIKNAGTGSMQRMPPGYR